jgi:hypothetical protein
MAEKPNNFGICECGDPSCKCKPGTCGCIQPSEKFLPKEDKGNVKDGPINLPVDPATYLNTYDGESLYNANPKKGPYQALKTMEIPSDNTFFKDKQAAINEAGKESFPFWKQALERLQTQLADNVDRMANQPGTKFYSKACSWKVGKDGMREVSYNFIEEVKASVEVSGSMASAAKQMTSVATWDKKLVLSKHMDDKSAMLACQAYNEYLALKK